MSMLKLAFINFKSSFKNYLALIISLSFTILILFNFQNIIYSKAFETLGKMNARNINSVVQVITVVLICFMLFFIWYSTNVFLSKRKKEIGIYVFMGLTNSKIGKLYMIETIMIGLSALVLGLFFGIVTSQLFQMILITVSDISVELQFSFSLEPVIFTFISYIIVYFIFVIKGYINIVRSSVLEMVSATKQNEYIKQNDFMLIVKMILGITILGSGYYYAIKDAGMEVIANLLLAVVLVIIGVYLLFGGFVPFLFQTLARNKMFLYKYERNLWINNMIFRIKKNYRTYAIVCVLMLCSVTALATGFAMNNRYENIVHFRNTYTYQFTSNQSDLDHKIKSLINKDNDIEYSNHIPVLNIDSSLIDTLYKDNTYMFVSYSDIKNLAKKTNLEFDIPKMKSNEIVDITRLHLMSFTDKSNITQIIDKKEYKQVCKTAVPYLGTLQEHFSFFMVSDDVYENLKSKGTEMYCYNYKIKDVQNFKESKDELDTIVSETNNDFTTYFSNDPNNKEIEWVKILYSVCIFMFMVFIFASGSIIFMKLYNDAFDDKARYEVLKKIGIDHSKLKKSIAHELGFAYIGPFVIMMISSYFSVLALSKVMETELLMVNMISVAVIFVFFVLCYYLSLFIYQKNANI